MNSFPRYKRNRNHRYPTIINISCRGSLLYTPGPTTICEDTRIPLHYELISTAQNEQISGTHHEKYYKTTAHPTTPPVDLTSPPRTNRKSQPGRRWYPSGHECSAWRRENGKLVTVFVRVSPTQERNLGRDRPTHRAPNMKAERRMWGTQWTLVQRMVE